MLKKYCDKIGHNSHSAAERVLKSIRSRKGEVKPKVIYKCTICGNYHLSSVKKKS